MKALLLIDIQNDFLPGGALPVANGREVIPVANRLIAAFDLVVATQDWHPADHGSFAVNHQGGEIGATIELDGQSQILWPVHCVQGTAGAEFAADLDTARLRRVFHKGTDRRIDSYSGFFDNGHRKRTGLETYLRQLDVDELYLLGLATDYCVASTALDARRVAFRTHLVLDGCRGVERKPGDIDDAVRRMRAAGVIVLHSSQLHD